MDSVRDLPLRVRFGFAFGVAAAIFAALAIYVHQHQQQSEGVPAALNKTQAAVEEQQQTVVIEQQQSPHVVALRAGASQNATVAATITSYMRAQVNQGVFTGPLDGSASCRSGGEGRFACNVTAGASDARLRYPFRAMIASAGSRVTFCQVVTPPYPLKPIALSPACG